MKVLVAQSCPTLCDPMACSSTGSPSMRFPRQEYWSRLPCSLLGDLPDPEIEPWCPTLHADALPLSHKGHSILKIIKKQASRFLEAFQSREVSRLTKSSSGLFRKMVWKNLNEFLGHPSIWGKRLKNLAALNTLGQRLS